MMTQVTHEKVAVENHGAVPESAQIDHIEQTIRNLKGVGEMCLF